ncbi:glyoxal reductase [Levilactobacillus brevis]|nr:aldo/keto reductase [Levilactobacillus brevis]ANN49744.1 glyoxal reductase [Levilactobacillus brevis]ARN93241.1 glyoxal reductase [Levilactobacillus brevis]ARN95861.1 glyoxal reductase [Levilactobacillus brevis]KIO99347.1 oxidoreductase of aldo/keto reductase family, subgroup 1 [Levilactobacillus brevis]KRK21131.1 aldo keto reductase [Levilactobacillus brevis ATCC 14869 = DSM 20054]
METTQLSNGVTIPMLGFGTYLIDSKDVPAAIKTALDAGYRHLDCAHIYGNEPAVGEAIKASGIDRSDLFITSKVWNADQGYDKTLVAFDQTLSDLQLDYLDLYLIHWPNEDDFELTLDTWRALETLYQQKKVRAIGVSNFSEDQLKQVFEMATVKPMVNQIERHPYKVQADLGQFDTDNDIVNEGYSPIGHGHLILEDPVITKLAEKYGKSPAQIVLRWQIDTGFVVFPKSSKPARVKENFEISGFNLTADEIAEINGLDQDKHLNYD